VAGGRVAREVGIEKLTMAGKLSHRARLSRINLRPRKSRGLKRGVYSALTTWDMEYITVAHALLSFGIPGYAMGGVSLHY
jgi:hypothetical protein